MSRYPVRLAVLLGLFASPLAWSAAADPTLAQAEQLLQQRQPQAALELLAPLEDERGGHPDYDYLYGLAALEAGKPGLAAFAFERCLAVDPRHGPCRVLMARTHMALGEHQRARQELDTVRQSQPPAAVDDLVRRYLGLLGQQEQRQQRRLGAYAQLGSGYDSNVTSTTPQDQIAIPALGGTLFTLTGVSTKQEDPFLQAEAGVNGEYRLSPAWTLVGEAGLAGRRYEDVDAFDSLATTATVGAAWQQGPNSLQARLQAQDYQLGHNDFRSLYGVLAQYQYAFSEQAAVSAYLQSARLDNHVAFSADADRHTLGAGYARALETALAPALYTGLYGGREEAESNSPGLSHDFYGLRLGGSLTLQAELRLTASLSIEQRDYEGVDPTFATVRDDTATDLSLGAIYQLGPRLSLRPTYAYSHNDSSIVLSDYDRHVVALDLRYEM